MRCFWNQRIRGHGICDGFGTSHGSSLRWFWKQRIRGPWYLRCGVFRCPGRPRRTTSVLQKVDFPATEAPRVRSVLRLYYKSRLSSHGSSGCPRRTIRLYYKKSTFQPRKLCVSAAYYVLLQKVDFPATEAPGVPGVLNSVLQKSTFQPRKLRVCSTKSRLSSHGSSACPRRTTFVLQKSTFPPRTLHMSAAYYFCTTRVDFPAMEAPGVPVYYICTRKVDFLATEVPGVLRLYYKRRQRRKNTTGLYVKKRKKNDGFGTAPTPKHAEG